MKKRVSKKVALRCMMLAVFILLAGISAARAQVTPRVCVETSYQTGTTTLAQAVSVGSKSLTVDGYVPPLVSIIINPGGATEERFNYVNVRMEGSGPYKLGFNETFHSALFPTSFVDTTSYYFRYEHAAGETVRYEGYAGTASFGYRNAGNGVVTIPRGVTSYNFFTPGPVTYAGQPSQFQPGIYENVVTLPFGGRATDSLSWVLGRNVNEVTTAVARNNQGQNCAKITYQGRLTDAGNAANGEYDFRLTVFDAETGGAPQSAAVVVENATVTNGIFTVYPNFYASFVNNQAGRFLEIAVRPGNSTGGFTVLAPRQPITSVPYAVNAQTAQNALVYLIPRVTSPPPYTVEGGCDGAALIGNTRLDTTTSRLYVCTPTGWKSVLLE